MLLRGWTIILLTFGASGTGFEREQGDFIIQGVYRDYIPLFPTLHHEEKRIQVTNRNRGTVMGHYRRGRGSQRDDDSNPKNTIRELRQLLKAWNPWPENRKEKPFEQAWFEQG